MSHTAVVDILLNLSEILPRLIRNKIEFKRLRILYPEHDRLIEQATQIEISILVLALSGR